jgi:hypothetical protein
MMERLRIKRTTIESHDRDAYSAYLRQAQYSLYVMSREARRDAGA